MNVSSSPVGFHGTLADWLLRLPTPEGKPFLVAFEHGDPNHPYVVGFLWNGQDKPPITDPKRRLIHSVNGHEIELHDPAVAQGDTGGIRIQDAHGNIVELTNGSIRIQSVGTLQITAPNVIMIKSNQKSG